MGLIRGGLVVVLSVLLLLSFLAGNLFLTLGMSLDYDVVKPELTAVAQSLGDSELNLNSLVDDKLVLMGAFCENDSEYVFNEGGYTFVIPCEVITQGSDAIVNHCVEGIVDDYYYKEYDCDFWDCFEESDMPVFLVSQKAQDYWKGKFYWCLTLAVVLLALLFLFVEAKSNAFIVSGGLLILSALPFMKLDWVLGFVSDKTLLGFFTLFFTQSHYVFWISLGIGIILLAVGIVMKFFGIGFKISGFLNKFGKNRKISKGEVGKMVEKEVSRREKNK